jgi:hypothetical protein
MEPTIVVPAKSLLSSPAPGQTTEIEGLVLKKIPEKFRWGVERPHWIKSHVGWVLRRSLKDEALSLCHVKGLFPSVTTTLIFGETGYCHNIVHEMNTTGSARLHVRNSFL